MGRRIKICSLDRKGLPATKLGKIVAVLEFICFCKDRDEILKYLDEIRVLGLQINISDKKKMRFIRGKFLERVGHLYRRMRFGKIGRQGIQDSIKNILLELNEVLEYKEGLKREGKGRKSKKSLWEGLEKVYISDENNVEVKILDIPVILVFHDFNRNGYVKSLISQLKLTPNGFNGSTDKLKFVVINKIFDDVEKVDVEGYVKSSKIKRETEIYAVIALFPENKKKIVCELDNQVRDIEIMISYSKSYKMIFKFLLNIKDREKVRKVLRKGYEIIKDKEIKEELKILEENLDFMKRKNFIKEVKKLWEWLDK